MTKDKERERGLVVSECSHDGMQDETNEQDHFNELQKDAHVEKNGIAIS